MLVVDAFKSRSRLEAENLFLRHQLNIALRRAPPHLRLRGSDRAFMVWLVRLWPSLLGVTRVVQPGTILRWHRAGFRVFWRWKSRNRVGRPRIDRGLRELIQRMSTENPLWGASRIHGELQMLGFEVAQSTVSKYMRRGGKPPSQNWRTFLRNHAEAIAAIDLCVVWTLTSYSFSSFSDTAGGSCFGLRLHGIPPPSGWRDRSPRRFPGRRRRTIWSATMIVPTGMSLHPACGPWVSAIGQSPQHHHSKMALPNA
jgi:hypothetical protein